MAATCLDIITYAMRQARVLGPGKEPKAAEAEEGMVALQSFYDELVQGGMFGRLEDSYLTSDDTAEEGKRYLLASGVTLTEPTTIAAEDSADGIARQPRDLSVYEKVTSAGRSFGQALRPHRMGGSDRPCVVGHRPAVGSRRLWIGRCSRHVWRVHRHVRSRTVARRIGAGKAVPVQPLA
jgi:hypothetical protein